MDAESQITLSPRADLALSALEQHLKSEKTLEDVVANPLVLKFAREDALSTNQQGLVATVVTIMQDRIITDLRNNNNYLKASLERQSFVTALFSSQTAVAVARIYSAPLFTLPSKAQPADQPTAEEQKKKSFFATVFTWGNFCAGSAIVLLAISLIYTKAYASYKERAEAQAGIIEQHSKTITTTSQQRDDAQKGYNEAKAKLDALQADLEKSQALADARATRITELASQISDLAKKAGASPEAIKLQGDLEQKNQDLQKATSDSARYQQMATSATQRAEDFRVLYDEEKVITRKQAKAIETLNNENTKMKTEMELQKKRKS